MVARALEAVRTFDRPNQVLTLVGPKRWSVRSGGSSCRPSLGCSLVRFFPAFERVPDEGQDNKDKSDE